MTNPPLCNDGEDSRIIVSETPQGYLVGRTNTLLGNTVTSTFLLHDTDPWIDRALRLEKIKLYTWFADDLLRGAVTRYPRGGGTVSFFDMRYGNPVETDHYLWAARRSNLIVH